MFIEIIYGLPVLSLPGTFLCLTNSGYEHNEPFKSHMAMKADIYNDNKLFITIKS